jgi:hypothetical protein
MLWFIWLQGPVQSNAWSFKIVIFQKTQTFTKTYTLGILFLI